MIRNDRRKVEGAKTDLFADLETNLKINGCDGNLEKNNITRKKCRLNETFFYSWINKTI